MTTMTASAFDTPWVFGTESGASEIAQKITHRQGDWVTDLARRSATGHMRLSELAIDILKTYNESHVNRDGDSEPVSLNAVSEAMRLLPTLPWNLPIPEIFADPTGAVAFEWYVKPGHRFAIAIYGDHRIEYTGLFGKWEETYGETRFTAGLPHSIWHALKRLYP